jgi:HK97 gp10 family phage protein
MSVQYTNKFEEALKEIGEGIASGLALSAELLSTNIRKETPVLTGYLKSQIIPDAQVSRSGSVYSTSVGTEVEYAKYVEYGTSSQSARAMFRSGADNSKSAILSLLSKNLPK